MTLQAKLKRLSAVLQPVSGVCKIQVSVAFFVLQMSSFKQNLPVEEEQVPAIPNLLIGSEGVLALPGTSSDDQDGQVLIVCPDK